MKSPSAAASIHAIGVAVPEHAYDQAFSLACMKRWLPEQRLRRVAHLVYRHSGIRKRHSVLPDFVPGAEPLLFREGPDGCLNAPTTGQRNAVYAAAYGELVQRAVASALEAAPDLSTGDITHLITVSCTGFCNPGPDLFLARAFGLRPSVERYHLGFMGCYAAFPALRMAEQFCRAQPDAVVLVVCIELCSLHLQIDATEDSLLANSLFADGAAAALVTARSPQKPRRVLALDLFSTRQVPEGLEQMAWTIGDHGFAMTLSSYVPKLLKGRIGTLLDEMLRDCEIDRSVIDAWAIHPGGRAILRGVESGLALAPGALRCCHEVLSEYGNMSSASILFVLQRWLVEESLPHGNTIAALAFGPGLTVELALLKAVGVLSVPGASADEEVLCTR